MPRLYQVRDLLSDVLGMHSMTMDRHVGKLRDAGVLPANTAANVDAEHAARMMLAMLGGQTPSDAIDALRTFERLELLVLERREQRDDCLIIRETRVATAADVPMDAGGPDWFALVDALPLALETGHIAEIAIRRNLNAPLAIVELPSGIRLLYGRRQTASGLFAAIEAVGRGKLDMWVTLRSEGVQAIVALLAGRPPVAVAEGQPAPMIH